MELLGLLETEVPIEADWIKDTESALKQHIKHQSGTIIIIVIIIIIIIIIILITVLKCLHEHIHYLPEALHRTKIRTKLKRKGLCCTILKWLGFLCIFFVRIMIKKTILVLRMFILS